MLADYGQIVPAALLDLPHGALNLHPSLLPRHRGASPIPATILAGDAETGVTLMRMDAGLDTGPIVGRDACAARRGPRRRPSSRRASPTRPPTCSADTSARGCAGELDAEPQPTRASTLTRPLRREDGRLDPHRPATELERQVRAYQPWPGTFLETPTAGSSCGRPTSSPTADRAIVRGRSSRRRGRARRSRRPTAGWCSTRSSRPAAGG